MVKAVIFDMDGVLIDTEKWLVKYWCQAAREAGFPMEREHALSIRSLAGEYANTYLKGIFGKNFSYWTIRERRKELMNAHLKEYGIEYIVSFQRARTCLNINYISCDYYDYLKSKNNDYNGEYLRPYETDMASQMVEFTKNQILTQSGTAMLAQANSQSSNVLGLLS